MAQTKFITAAEIATIAFAHANSEVSAYAKDSIILLMQRQLLYKDLGKALYEDLGDNPETEINATILADYIKPCLAFAIKAKIAPDMHNKLTNAGGIISTPQHARPVEDRGLNSIVTNAENISKGFKSQLLEYLEDNKEDYPLYTSTEDGPTAKESDPRTVAGWIMDRSNTMGARDYNNFSIDSEPCGE